MLLSSKIAKKNPIFFTNIFLLITNLMIGGGCQSSPESNENNSSGVTFGAGSGSQLEEGSGGTEEGHGEAGDGGVEASGGGNGSGKTSSSNAENSSGSQEDGEAGQTGEEQSSSNKDDGESSIRFDVGAGGETGGEPRPTPNARIEGVVYSPDGSIPVSGALVYATRQDVEGIPDHVYCEECVEFSSTDFWTLTNEDGSFSLDTIAGENTNFVVQKGQFLRVTKMDLPEGETVIDGEESWLPAAWKPEEGQWIPKMAIAHSGNDTIHDMMAKIGLGQLVAGGVTLEVGTEPFDVYGGSFGNIGAGEFLDDLELMKQYHYLFVPCMAQGPMGALTETRIENIREWVKLGGKLYVTDWANEYLYETFPGYQSFYQPDSPDFGGHSTTGRVIDAELLEWMNALPDELKDPPGAPADFPGLTNLPEIEVPTIGCALEETPEIWVDVDDESMPRVNIGHYSWVVGPDSFTDQPELDRPMAVSARYGCGRMMFSTFHTNVVRFDKLSAQELVLWYIILEIGVCQKQAIPIE